MPETIGQQLKQARLAKNLSIDQVVQATRIRSNAITALEADEFESLPSAAQARGFLKLYAEYLGLALEDMVARQREPSASDLATTSAPNPTGKVDSEQVYVSEEPPASPPPPKTPRLRKKVTPPSDVTDNVPQAPPVPVEEPLADGGKAVEMEPASESRDQAIPGDQKTTEATPASQLIFTAIGRNLRQRRESLSLSLDEIERHTHVRRHFLEVLEAGDFGQLPSSVQARGMLNNYARFLDLDVDSVLLEFATGLQTQLAERQPQPAKAPIPSRKSLFKFTLPASLRRVLSADILVGGGVLILLVIFAIWGTGRIIKLSTATTPEPTAPSISNILLSSTLEGAPTATLNTSATGLGTPSLESGATLDASQPTPGDGPVQIILSASRKAWVKVIVDNVVEYEGRVFPGTVYAYDAETQIEIITGDGSAVSIIYNQSDLGAMGAYGEIVHRIYTATTILLPTATFTPTPTISQTPTITPRPSATKPPSITPRPSATPDQ